MGSPLQHVSPSNLAGAGHGQLGSCLRTQHLQGAVGVAGFERGTPHSFPFLLPQRCVGLPYKLSECLDMTQEERQLFTLLWEINKDNVQVSESPFIPHKLHHSQDAGCLSIQSAGIMMEQNGPVCGKEDLRGSLRLCYLLEVLSLVKMRHLGQPVWLS